MKKLKKNRFCDFRTQKILFFNFNFILFQDPFTRNLRRTVMRYVNLSIVLVFRLVSAKVHARFPDYQSLIKAKLMLPSGCRTFQSWTFNPILSSWTFQPIIAKTSHTVILPD